MQSMKPKLSHLLVRSRAALVVAAALWLLPMTAWAATEVVTGLEAAPASGVWYDANSLAGGEASIEDLTGLGGDLESGAPLPTGAALLTTGADAADRAEISIGGPFGFAADVIDGDLVISYSYYKEASGDAAPAPALKLVFFDPVGPCPSPDGDCFATLVYEPSWNQPGNEGVSTNPPTGAWTTVNITESSGLFWSTGGFGEPGSGGGPPLRTLADWRAILDPSFLNAFLVEIGVGVGTANLDQIGYVDQVALTTSGPSAVDTTWDFEAPAAPGPSELFVDISSNQGPAPVQAGYTGVDGTDASDGTPVNVNGVDISLASAGVETDDTGINGRDRGALAGTQALSDLARDFAFAWGEDLVLTLDGLEPGFYEWTGYFHDNTVDQGVATISLSTDGGVTFDYGPEPTSHSTTTDPERIETLRTRFVTDGSAAVVVRISNSDLPTPAVRPILNGFDLREAAPIRSAHVDFSSANHPPGPVQEGYTGVTEEDASDGTPVVVNGFAVALESTGTEVGSTGTDGRDRGALDPSQPLSDLARDFAFAFGENLDLTLGGLSAGRYTLTGYFHDNTADQGDSDLLLSLDGGATFAVGPVTVTNSTTTNPPAITTETFVFETDGTSDVVLRVSNPDLPAPSVRPVLNGFDLVLFDADNDAVHVDFFDLDKGFSPVQPGFLAVDLATVADGSEVDLGAARLSVSSSDGITPGAALDGRDRGALAPGQTGSPLARDFIFSLEPNLDITLDGLEPGSYVFSGVFHDSDVDQGEADLTVSEDGGLTFGVGPVVFDHSTTPDPAGLSFASVVFESNGLDPVVIRIANPDLPAPAVRPILNGFALAAPEPSIWLGFVSGLGLLVGLHRVRRR